MGNGIGMTDEKRCEPPEHLRGVDGWHWVRWHGYRTGNEFIAYWDPNHEGGAWDAATPWLNRDENGRKYIYLAPVAPPDVVREMVEALEDLVDVQVFATGWDNGVTDSTGMVNEGDYFHSQSMDRARAALHRAKEAGV